MTEHLLGYKGSEVVEQPGCQIGLAYAEDAQAVEFGGKAMLRSNTVIYGDVTIGKNFQCGHGVLIRERTQIGNHVLVGTNSVIDGQVAIGDFVKIETNCYVCSHVIIGSRVFIGPNVVFTNDRLPLKKRAEYKPEGAIIGDGVTLGAGVILLPGITIGEGSFVAAGALVTRDIPANRLVIGAPARHRPLPEELREKNMALSWMGHLDD